MTDSPAPIPAGWYPDATTPGLIRWWDGGAWTEHTAAATGDSGTGRPLLPADRPVYSPFIWAIVLLPLLSYASLFAWTPDFSYLSNATTGTRLNPLSIYTPGYFVILALGWVSYGLIVFFAYRDVVWLRRQGVVRPFHWAFAFLGGLVYIIGRSVIVRKVAAPRGLVPIWATIGVYVIGIIVVIGWTVLITNDIVDQVRPGLGG
jgi:hypothetical protein